MHSISQYTATSPVLEPINQPFAVHQGRVVSRGNFWSEVKLLAERLPDSPYVFNLCENRYLFCLCLMAAAVRGQVCLLPPSNQMAVVQEISLDYPGAYLASECDPQLPDLTWFEVETPKSQGSALEADIDWKLSTVIAFTSGSTGRPKPCVHSLETFRISAAMAVRSLGLEQKRLLMLSTTPPQHMYGLETSVFWPLFSDLLLHDERPFFPADIRHAVETAAWPVVLVSTPTHLRSLTKANGPWLNLNGVISATDSLSEKLASEICTILGQSPREIYGSTETLSFASKETLSESLWTPYANSRLIPDQSGQVYLESPHLTAPILLQDRIRVESDGRFAMLGRQQDMVKIGGKRASLAELNRRLKDIDGVEDGFCIIQKAGQGEARLAAIVVSRLDRHCIRSGLQPYVDQVFLPRKIIYVDAIPRNEAGKLVSWEMEKLLADSVEPI